MKKVLKVFLIIIIAVAFPFVVLWLISFITWAIHYKPAPSLPNTAEVKSRQVVATIKKYAVPKETACNEDSFARLVPIDSSDSYKPIFQGSYIVNDSEQFRTEVLQAASEAGYNVIKVKNRNSGDDSVTYETRDSPYLDDGLHNTMSISIYKMSTDDDGFGHDPCYSMVKEVHYLDGESIVGINVSGEKIKKP